MNLRFAVIGINHGHIYAMMQHMFNVGVVFAKWYVPEPDLAAEFAKKYDTIPQASSEAEILEDEAIQIVLSASIASYRAPLGIRVMQHGKDFMADKPGITSLEQLALVKKVQAQTKQIYSICYSEYYDSSCTNKAYELVQAGAIGRVVQTLGIGPHRTRPEGRPQWFFEREHYGGILTDIGSHQVAQFLFFTNSTQAKVTTSTVANYRYPQYPGLEDFGEMVLEGDGGHGYVRLDWYTPEGLSTWGDGRLVVLGTEGYLECRKYVNVAVEASSDHLFMVDQKGEHKIDCAGTDIPYGRNFVFDVLNRTETHTAQARIFLAMELALTAEKDAKRLGNLLL